MPYLSGASVLLNASTGHNMPSVWDLQTILSRYRFSAADCAVEPLTSGLINTTYCLTDQRDRRRYILQRINQSVFSPPR